MRTWIQPLQLSTILATTAMMALNTYGAEVVPIPLVPGIRLSGDYTLEVNRKIVPVGVETSAKRTFHTASFCMAGTASLKITVKGGFKSNSIHPLRLELKGKQQGKELSFSIHEPRKLMIRFDGRRPLLIMATPLEKHVPDPDDPKVHYYGPGKHKVGRLKVKSGETVYLAGGARFIGTIEGEGVENVKVMGRGMLDGSQHTDWKTRIFGLVFDRSKNITVEGIAIRNCYWWTTEFLLCDKVDISHINIFTFNRNNGGIMTDSCKQFSCKQSMLFARDDCICPHALNAAGNGEPSSTYLFEDCVLYNVHDGNAIRIGASFETQEVLNWTFRRIDVLYHERGAAIFADHSDWATVRNLRFIDFHDEDSSRPIIDMKIVKTKYSCNTGYKDERGNFDGLYFVNLQSPGGGISLQGFDSTHRFNNVYFYNCKIGKNMIDTPSDLAKRSNVDNLHFISDGSKPDDTVVQQAPPPSTSQPAELILDDGDVGFRSVGFEKKTDKSSSFGKDCMVAAVPTGFSNFKAAIYEPRIRGRYKVYMHLGDFEGKATNARWIVQHADGYAIRYLNQNTSPGWLLHGEYTFDGNSSVRLALPGYFQVADNPVVADAVRFVKVD